MRNNQGELCKFSVATSRKWKDKKTGEQKEDTSWHNIVVFNEYVIKNVCYVMLRKGTHVYIEGELKTRKYEDKDGGKDRYITEIVIASFKGEIIVLNEGKNAPNENPGANRTDRGSGQQQAGAAARDEFDDDIPF